MTGQRAAFVSSRALYLPNILLQPMKSTARRPRRNRLCLRGMQERQVSIGGKNHKLPDPFFVLATQNPIEQEGTYPLPEGAA